MVLDPPGRLRRQQPLAALGLGEHLVAGRPVHLPAADGDRRQHGGQQQGVDQKGTAGEPAGGVFHATIGGRS